MPSVPRRRAGDIRLDSGRASAPVRVVVLDGNRVLREGIAAMAHAHPGFEVMSPEMDVDHALAELRELRPDVVLVDAHQAHALTARVRAQSRETHIVVTGVAPHQADVSELLRSGASAFVMRDASFQVFLATIRAAAHGAQVLPRGLTESRFAQGWRPAVQAPQGRPDGAARLTERELEVVALLGDGLSNRDIALRLQIAIHTVKSHVHHVLAKLALRSRLEVAAFARQGPRLHARQA